MSINIRNCFLPLIVFEKKTFYVIIYNLNNKNMHYLNVVSNGKMNLIFESNQLAKNLRVVFKLKRMLRNQLYSTCLFYLFMNKIKKSILCRWIVVTVFFTLKWAVSLQIVLFVSKICCARIMFIQLWKMSSKVKFSHFAHIANASREPKCMFFLVFFVN